MGPLWEEARGCPVPDTGAPAVFARNPPQATTEPISQAGSGSVKMSEQGLKMLRGR